jgi:hypothetical protein|uniref:DUF3789 domain-containing protein n=1 Tax=Desulfobacca acetoxidans TaxID=60893 RepID=A0A7C3WL02_9BACT
MGWLMFFLGMMVGSTVGVGAMCLLFYARDPEMLLKPGEKCPSNSPPRL